MELRRLVIVSHVIIFRHNGLLYAHAPYARELNIWADLFREVIIASPYREGPPFPDSEVLARKNITVAPQRESGGERPGEKIMQVFSLPLLLWDLARAIRSGDAVHVRCPGNVGLMGLIVAPLFSRHMIAKYAGQWASSGYETLSVKVQKAILRSFWWRGPVTVYGRWPGQRPNIVPFFTSVLTAPDIARARRAAEAKQRKGPLRVLYVGRLSSSKNVDILLSAVAKLPDVRCTIVGSGPEMNALQKQAAALGIMDRVVFAGGVGVDEVLGFYETSDVLVLASDTEGWGKALAEGMAFGTLCIGSNRGFVPQMLGDGRGIIVPPKDVDALAGALSWAADHPDESAAIAARAATWAQKFSLEDLRDALRDLLRKSWGVDLLPPGADEAGAGGNVAQ